VFQKKFICNLNADGIENDDIQRLYASQGYFLVQGRHITTESAYLSSTSGCDQIEAPYTTNIDSAFSLYFQWCGRMGLESCRMFMQVYPEQSVGRCDADETGVNIITVDGKAIHLDETVSNITLTAEASSFVNQQISTFYGSQTPRYREVFYSSIPVTWQDLPDGCVTCLPCARDTFAPPTEEKIVIDGITVN
jgi:hypothetical protein